MKGNNACKTDDKGKIPCQQLLDDKVCAMMTSDCHHKGSTDTTRWFSVTSVVVFFNLVILTVCWSNPVYLTSDSAYPNGAHAYQSVASVLRVMAAWKNRSTSLWSQSGSLGHPLFISSEPLPCIFTTTVAFLFQSLLSPLCVFRCLIVFITALIPVTTYRGARTMLLTRLHASVSAMLALLVQSNAQLGYELDAIFTKGLYNQMFGMLLLPLAVSAMFNYNMQLGRPGENWTIFMLCTLFCCHIPSAVTCSLFACASCVTYILTKRCSLLYAKAALGRLVTLHLKCALYLLWWIVPAVISYPYVNNKVGLTPVNYLPPTQFAIEFITGRIFDENRSFIVFTCLVVCVVILAGAIVFAMFKRKRYLVHSNLGERFCLWLLVAWAVACMCSQFFKNIPIHFIGILLAGFAISKFTLYLAAALKRHISQRNTINCLFVITAALLMFGTALRLKERVMYVKTNERFEEELVSFGKQHENGRLLLHEKLGTGSSWDMESIPHITNKPGVFSYNVENPSTFYLDSMMSTATSEQHLRSFLELFNVHYMATAGNHFDEQLLRNADVEKVVEADDFSIYKTVQHEEKRYGMFDFVRLPGYIDGNMKNIRQAVLQTIPLFSHNVLFYLNPRNNANIRAKPLLDVQAIALPFYEATSSDDASLVNWKLDGRDAVSYDVVERLRGMYALHHWQYSVVLHERMVGESEYHALVHVVQQSEKMELQEHLLLKVSYHPFWRCSYTAVTNDYELTDYNKSLAKATTAQVHHVSPNLMAVELPMGRYHVILRYRFPGILKIYAVLSLLVLLDKLLSIRITGHVKGMAKSTYRLICRFSMYTFTCLLFSVNSMFYSDRLPQCVTYVKSFLANPVLTLKPRKGLSQTIKNLSFVTISIDTFSRVNLAVRNSTAGFLLSGKKTPTKVSNRGNSLKETVQKIHDCGSKEKWTPVGKVKHELGPSSSVDNISASTPSHRHKKSVRKKYYRKVKDSFCYDGDDDGSFQSADSSKTSPRLSNILSSLRQSFQKPKQKISPLTSPRRHSLPANVLRQSSSSMFHDTSETATRVLTSTPNIDDFTTDSSTAHLLPVESPGTTKRDINGNSSSYKSTATGSTSLHSTASSIPSYVAIIPSKDFTASKESCAVARSPEVMREAVLKSNRSFDPAAYMATATEDTFASHEDDSTKEAGNAIDVMRLISQLPEDEVDSISLKENSDLWRSLEESFSPVRSSSPDDSQFMSPDSFSDEEEGSLSDVSFEYSPATNSGVSYTSSDQVSDATNYTADVSSYSTVGEQSRSTETSSGKKSSYTTASSDASYAHAAHGHQDSSDTSSYKKTTSCTSSALTTETSLSKTTASSQATTSSSYDVKEFVIKNDVVKLHLENEAPNQQQQKRRQTIGGQSSSRTHTQNNRRATIAGKNTR